MNERELDLVAQLAPGELSGDRLSEAEALVAARPDLAEELALQRLAIEVMSADSPPLLTELEAVRMRRDVADAIGLVEPAAEPSRSFGWLAPALVAAVVVVVFAVGPFIGSLSTGRDTDAQVAETTTASQASSETTVAATADEFASAEAGEPSPAAEESPLTSRSMVGSGILDLGEVTTDELDALAGQVEDFETTETIAADTTTSTDAADHAGGDGALAFTYGPEAEACVSQYTETSGATMVTAVATATLDGTPVVVVIESRDDVTRLLALDPADCTVRYAAD